VNLSLIVWVSSGVFSMVKQCTFTIFPNVFWPILP
jgi:hypothetical protein